MANLPDYVAMAKPNPMANRAPWWKNTAQTYAGIMLWFVFWTYIPGQGGGANGAAAGMLSCGLGTALAALVAAALICHFLFYLVPGKLGMKTGLPLYIVGTSTYGVKGGFIMPGFLMGLLQFGWLAVNGWGAGCLFTSIIKGVDPTVAAGDPMCVAIAIAWAVVAAFVGLKGIKYVAGVATFFPIIPIVILLLLFAKTAGGIGDFDASKIGAAAEVIPAAAVEEAAPVASEATADEVAADAPADAPAPAAPVVEETAAAEAAPVAGEATSEAASVECKPSITLSTFGVFNFMAIYILGFFATAGAAGCDMGTASRNSADVQLGGLIGILGSTVFAGGLSLAIYAGAYGAGIIEYAQPVGQTTDLISGIMGGSTGKIMMLLLAIAAFPSACFSALIAANSFKTTLPKVNPFITCGLGTLAAIILIVTKTAGDCVAIFNVIGASFGPICGAMAADYLLSGRKWNGPRAGFNPAGWISWFFGFVVGAFNFFPASVTNGFVMPCPPLVALVVGFVLYFILGSIGVQSKTLEMDAVQE